MLNVSPQPEGSLFSPRQIRLLKISIAIMTTLLILGILALIYGMARQASRVGTQASPEDTPKPYELKLDTGQAGLAGVSATRDLLILHLRGAGLDTLVVIDPRDGHEAGRIQVPVH
jgi:hypothetical protein